MITPGFRCTPSRLLSLTGGIRHGRMETGEGHAAAIIERQRDRQTREFKCVIRGPILDDRQAETIVKIGPTGRLVVITVYLA